jgi:hypothetical protein
MMFMTVVLAAFAWFLNEGYEVTLSPRSTCYGIIARHPEDIMCDVDILLISPRKEWVSILMPDGWTTSVKTAKETTEYMESMYLSNDLIHKGNVAEILYRMSGDLSGVANEIVYAAYERADIAVKALL